MKLKGMVLFLIMAAPLIVHCPPPPSYYESGEYSRATKDKNHYFRFEGDGFWYKLQVYTSPYSNNHDVHILLTIHNLNREALEFDARKARIIYNNTEQPLRLLSGCGVQQSESWSPCTIGGGAEVSAGYTLWDNENTALPDTVTICVDGIIDPATDSVLHTDCVIFTAPHR